MQQATNPAAPTGGTSSAEIWIATQWPHGRYTWCDPDYDTPETFRSDWKSFLADTDGKDSDRFLRWYFSVGDVTDIPDWAAEVVAEMALETD